MGPAFVNAKGHASCNFWEPIKIKRNFGFGFAPCHGSRQVESVAGIQVLVLHQNLVDVVRVRRAAGEVVF